MKKLFSMALAAVALLASGAASMGCLWLALDEPSASEISMD